MSGHYNHSIIEREAADIRVAYLNGYDMYSMGAFPGIVPGLGIIHGELIHINPQHYDYVLHNLDQLEGYSHGCNNGIYLRRVGIVTCTDTNEQIEAWFYQWNRQVSGPKYINSGRWAQGIKKGRKTDE